MAQSACGELARMFADAHVGSWPVCLLMPIAIEALLPSGNVHCAVNDLTSNSVLSTDTAHCLSLLQLRIDCYQLLTVTLSLLLVLCSGEIMNSVHDARTEIDEFNM